VVSSEQHHQPDDRGALTPFLLHERFVVASCATAIRRCRSDVLTVDSAGEGMRRHDRVLATPNEERGGDADQQRNDHGKRPYMHSDLGRTICKDPTRPAFH